MQLLLSTWLHCSTSCETVCVCVTCCLDKELLYSLKENSNGNMAHLSPASKQKMRSFQSGHSAMGVLFAPVHQHVHSSTFACVCTRLQVPLWLHMLLWITVTWHSLFICIDH